jgi:para-aminobenzoate synthetase component 1
MFKITATEEHKLQLIRWVDKHYNHYCLLDSNQYQEKYSTIKWEFAFGAKRVLSSSYENAFEKLKNFCDYNSSKIYGLLSYDLKNDTEKLISNNRAIINFPDIAFFEPEYIITEIDGNLISENFDFKNISTTINDEQINEHPQKHFKEVQTESEYIESIKLLKKHIYNGDIYEINYCISFIISEYNCNVVSIFNQLKQFSPNPFASLLKFNHQHIISASPERFLKKVGQKIISQPIKGTIKRTDDIERDKEELLSSEKERAENVMIVDLVRNDLKKCSETGTIQVEELFGIYTFPQLHQMISTIVGTAKKNVHVVDIIKSCFPMGSMTGAPKVRAMQLIEEYEKVKRSAFSGAIGYIDNNKREFDFNVIIRSLFYDEEAKVLSYNVGSAITYDSIPEVEYEECMLKAEAIKKVLSIK